MRQLLRRAWYLIRQRRFDADLREELEFHRAATQRELEDSGTDPTEARFAARRALGSVALAQDQARDVWTPRWLQGIGQDVRLAFRTLRTTPIVTAVAVLSLALGIGANTAIFSIIDSLALRALPVQSPEQLVFVSNSSSGAHAWGYPVWQEIRRRNLFAHSAAWALRRVNTARGGETQLVDTMWASGAIFETLGVQAVIGRTFSEADDQIDGGPDGPVAVISHAFWRRQFGGAPDVLGRRLTLGGQPFTIVGVTPPSFFGMEVGSTFDVIVPLETNHGPRESTVAWLTIIGRLRPGQSEAAVAAALRGVQPQIRDATLPAAASGPFRQAYLQAPFSVAPAAAGSSALRRQFERPLLAIMAVVVLVVLIASANITNLLLARATARRHDFSVRVALGASRWQLARQVLVEGGVLATSGTVLSALLAVWGSRALVRSLATQVNTQSPTVFLDLSFDGRVFAFTMAAAVVTMLFVGLAPACLASRVAPMDAMKEARTGTAGRTGGRWSSSLVVAQVAMSVVLVVAASLFVRTFVSLVARPLGFDANHLLVVNVGAPPAAVTPEQRTAVFERAADAVRELPEIAQAAASLVTPISGLELTNRITVSGGIPLPDDERGVLVNHVSPGWFQTYGIPVRAGRDFTNADRQSGPPVAIVNEAFARKFLDASPLDHFIAGLTSPVQIVGVVGDAVFDSLRNPLPATVYLPFAQSREAALFNMLSLSLRSRTGSTAPVVHSVANALRSVDPQLTWTARPLVEQIDASLTEERLLARLSGFFGALALLLAGIGLYGVTAYAVSRRQREIGIRLALGAAPAGVVRLVIARVGVLVGVGVLAGGLVSLWASRFVATLLYGLDPHDPATLIGAAVVLAAIAAVAGWIPAWRASRIDPAMVLRNE